MSRKEGIVPTKASLAHYYALKRINDDFGLLGKEERRIYRPIGHEKKLEDINPRELFLCVQEETDILRRGLSYLRFDVKATGLDLDKSRSKAKSWHDRAQALQAEINSYRAQLGLPPENG